MTVLVLNVLAAAVIRFSSVEVNHQTAGFQLLLVRLCWFLNLRFKKWPLGLKYNIDVIQCY